MSYREFSGTPQYKHVPNFSSDRDASPDPDGVPFWSGDKPLPAIGAKVRVKINNIGSGVAQKYFVEHGWLGLLGGITC
jgi:hypothetical protein